VERTRRVAGRASLPRSASRDTRAPLSARGAAMFSDCCMCESKVKGEENALPTIPGEDDPVIVAETTTIVHQQHYNSGGPPLDVGQGADGKSRQSSEERAIKKERMIEFVRQFVRDARHGLTCKLLDSAVGTQAVASLTLSRQNGLLVLDGFGEKKILLAHITDASLFEVLSRPPEAAQLSAEMADCCACVRFSEPGQCGEIEAYVIFDNKLDAERFVTCLQILRLYDDNRSTE